MHLRQCLTCGKIGCCDDSPSRHATAHFEESGHPLIRSAQPGEKWRWCFIDEVAFMGRLRMCELAEAVVLSPSGLSRRVDRLEREGLVTRERAERDARNVEARLTANGRRLLNRLRQTHREGVKNRFADRFSDSELELLSEFLGRLNNGS
jgi:DNA-binding MarR family transcriptional regulator